MIRKLFYVLVIVFAAMTSFSADVRSVVERRVIDADAAVDSEWLKLSTPEEFDAKRSQVRERLLKEIGEFPERTPLNAKTISVENRGEYRLEKIIYESRPGVLVTAVLFLPDTKRFAPPYPAFVFCCGHVDSGKDKDSYLLAGAIGALNGYAVLITDPLGQGEREQGAGVRNVLEHVRLGSQASLLGKSMVGMMLWDQIRGLDYLESRVDIRKGQFGCAGHSGGGTISSFLGALEPRIKAVAPACYISSLGEVIAACGPQDTEQNTFGQLKFGFNHLALMMLNDNPWCLNLARKDFFPYSGSLSTLEKAQRVAKASGRDPARYTSVSADGNHALFDEHREGLISWFNRYLLNEPNRKVVTNGASVAGLNVTVTPSGNVRDLKSFRSYYDYMMDDLAAVRMWRPLDNGRRDAEAARLAGVRLPRMGQFKGQTAVRSTTLIAAIGDQGEAERLMEDERKRGGTAESVRLTLADKTEWTRPVRSGKGSHYGMLADDEEVSVTLTLLGETLVGKRASELLECAAKEYAKTGRKPKLVAIGRAAIPAAFACAADRTAFSEVVVVGKTPLAWEESLRRRETVSFADLVPKALKVCDWPDLLPKRGVKAMDTVWTFGNHEPVAMYRRIGHKSTGGIEGSALWLEDWHHWFDSRDCTSLMRNLGLNSLHSRFFKGMGWEAEKGDFSAVRGFVENCHTDGIEALAYVQFLSLYYETFEKEVPDLQDWANRTFSGEIGRYGVQYARWLPCITSPDFERYLQRMAKIAICEGKFDGLMFDNIFVAPCYCARCERIFREWLERCPDASKRLGFSGFDSVRQPKVANLGKFGEIQDPLMQLWIEWRVGLLDAFFARMRAFVKSIDPQAVLCANTGAARSRNSALRLSRDMTTLAPTLDLVLGQSGNVPGLKDGAILNRVRDIKFLRCCGRTDLSLCDGDAGLEAGDERAYLLPLIEDLAFGGIPSDRTIVKPCRMEGFVDRAQLEFRRPLLARMKGFVDDNHAALSAPFFEPVKIFYPARGVRYSETAYRGILGAEEALLRKHVPFGYVISRPDERPTIPSDCEVLVVADQRCLSVAEIAAISSWARDGGRLVLSGDCGGWDDWNRQRLSSPLEELAGLSNVRIVPSLTAELANDCDWEYRVKRPQDGGEALVAALGQVGWRLPYLLEDVPETTFVEVRKGKDGYLLSFVNYDVAGRPMTVRINGQAYSLQFDFNLIRVPARQ